MSIYKTLASPTNTNSADSSKTDDMEEYFSDDDDLKRIRDGHRDNISTEGSSKRDSQFT